MESESIIFITGNRGRKLKLALEHTGWPIKYFELFAQQSQRKKIIVLQKILNEITSKYTKISLIIVDTVGFYALFLQIIAKFFHIRYAFRLRGDFWLELKEERSKTSNWTKKAILWFRSFFSEYLVKRSDFLLPVSNYLAERIISEAQIPQKRIKPVTTFIDTNQFNSETMISRSEIRRKLGFHSDDRIILSVTNFNYYDKAYGLHHFVPVFNKLLRDSDNIHWCIIGDGLYYEEIRVRLQSQITSLNHVQFVGKTSQVQQWYAACNFLLHFSFADGFPNVVLEAGASEKACIANRFGGMLEQIEDGVTGLLVDAANSDEVYQAACRLLYDIQYCETLGKQARKRISDLYTAQAVGAAFQRLLSNEL